MGLKEEVLELKEKKGAVILAHNYQLPEIMDVADFVGDSVELARAAMNVERDIIVFCGVDFMAETAKIMNPEKKVLMPELSAKCPMAAMLTVEEIRRKKEEHPDASVLLYVNTTAECKAEADYLCTSANAVKVARRIPNEEIIFGPDENLTDYVAGIVKKKFYQMPAHGNCPVHKMMGLAEILALKQEHEGAKVLAHPECTKEVREKADFIASTSGMVRIARENPANEFVIATENGLVYRLRKENPGKKFYPLSAVCPDMKKNTLQKVKKALLTEREEVFVDEKIAGKVRGKIEAMLA